MTNPETRSVVIEKEMPHPPEKVWRALTETSLLEQWLMKSDFEPAVGHKFAFRAAPVGGWDGVIACEVRAVEAPRLLSYTWSSLGVVSVVTLTLEPTKGGTRVRVEQAGFLASQERAYQGAKHGWERFLGNLDTLLGGMVRS